MYGWRPRIKCGSFERCGAEDHNLFLVVQAKGAPRELKDWVAANCNSVATITGCQRLYTAGISEDMVVTHERSPKAAMVWHA